MYTLEKAVVLEKTTATGKVITPVVGYLLKNEETNEVFVVSRPEAYRMGDLFTNAIPQSREVSCKEDTLFVDEKGLIYFLRLKPGHGKINEYLMHTFDLKEDITKSEDYFSAIEKVSTILPLKE